MSNKLLNKDETIPEVFYIFVNQLNPMTEHNFKLIGHFSSAAFGSLSDPGFLKKYIEGSARYLPYEPCQMDQWAISPFFLTVINEYRVEYDVESFREKHARLLPSRLSALYAFGDYETCKLVSSKYKWPLNSVQRFRLKPHPLNRVAKVNMEHISLARHAYRVASLQDVDALWQSYWSGEESCVFTLPAAGFSHKTYESGTIWEYLIEGVVEHLDRQQKVESTS
jgi:hypothetical protein